MSGQYVVGIVDAEALDHYTYTPHGQQTTIKASVANLFGYNGGLQVPGTPLVHFDARYYNPTVGQWTQLDPSGQNPGYVYAGDNPVNYMDRTGKSLFGDLALAGGALIGAGIGLVAVAAAPGALAIAGAAVGVASAAAAGDAVACDFGSGYQCSFIGAG